MAQAKTDQAKTDQAKTDIAAPSGDVRQAWHTLIDVLFEFNTKLGPATAVIGAKWAQLLAQSRARSRPIIVRAGQDALSDANERALDLQDRLLRANDTNLGLQRALVSIQETVEDLESEVVKLRDENDKLRRKLPATSQPNPFQTSQTKE